MRLITKDYKTRSTDLCLIAEKYDTDKCAIRKIGTRGEMDPGHSHPYSIFYHDFLKDKAAENLNVAEIGILKGSSLKMWRDYLVNSTIVGYDSNPVYLKNAAEIEGVTVEAMNIRLVESIKYGLGLHGPFDLIIEDTTHLFDDQIRFINEAHAYLKPGGHMIVEDVFKEKDFRTGQSHSVEEYCKHISPEVLSKFKDVYIVHLDHSNRRSTGWDNDGLLVFESYKTELKT